MRKILFIIVLIFITNLIYTRNYEKEIRNNPAYFEVLAEELIKGNKYVLLKSICNRQLRINSDNYLAAYYKALSKQKLQNDTALKYYLKFIDKNPDMPDNYKMKWLDIAEAITNEMNVKYDSKGIDFIDREIYLDVTDDSSNYTTPKVLENRNYFFFLDKSGRLYIIKKLTRETKKINFYKSKDFILMNSFLIFNDSINLIKYNYLVDKYSLINTFERDDIYFISKSTNSFSGIIKYNEENKFEIRKINFFSNEMETLPDNCVAQSYDYNFLVIDYSDKFDIFDISGKKLSTIEGDFIHFGKNNYDIFYYYKNYIYKKNIIGDDLEKIIYIPNYKLSNGFKMISPNKFLFCFDNYMMVYTLTGNKVNLIKGKLLHIFENGFMYMKENSSNIYFFSFYNNSSNLLFMKKGVFNKIIYPDNNSTIFFIKYNNIIKIYDLSDYFL